MIAALFVEKDGCYFGLPDVDPWDEARDARRYAGPHKVLAHPPCARWGRFWGGSTRNPHQFKMGDDGDCFAAAVAAVDNWGGVLEHPAHTHAWQWFNLATPPKEGGWVNSGVGYTCHVEQGWYEHLANKPTWLYAAHVPLPELHWGQGPQRLHPRALELHGYEKARRIGMMAMIGGKDKTKIRNATPIAFRDALLNICR